MSETLLDFHRGAMELAEEGFRARRAGDTERAIDMFRCALIDERRAAEMSEEQPTRSVLFRSAATLACDGRRWPEAMQMAGAGIASDPPEEILEELLAVVERVQRERAQSLRGLASAEKREQGCIEGGTAPPPHWQQATGEASQ